MSRRRGKISIYDATSSRGEGERFRRLQGRWRKKKKKSSTISSETNEGGIRRSSVGERGEK